MAAMKSKTANPTGKGRPTSRVILAWAIWFLSAFFMFYKNALEVSPSVMTSKLMGSFDINGAQLGNLVASYFYAYLLLQIPAGMLLDKIGPRRVTTCAIALCALGSILFATSDSIILAGVGRFLMGAGAAFSAINCIKLIASWFSHKQFAFMTGLMMSVAMIGAVVGQAPVAFLIEEMEWRSAMIYIGVFGLALAVLFYIIVRDQPSHKKGQKVSVTANISLWQSLRTVLNNKQTWWLSIYSGCAFAPIMVFGGLWGVSFIKGAYDLSGNMAAQAVSAIFIGFAVGAPILGWLSNWLGKRKVVMAWGTIVALFTISAVVYAPGVSQTFLHLLLFIFGFAISGFLLCFTMLSEITPPLFVATAIGFMNAFDAFFGAVTDPLTGLFLDLGWDGKLVDGARIFAVESYKMAFLILPIFLFVALFSLWRIKETHCRPVVPATLP